MKKECVIDSELFRKYCLEECENNCEKYNACIHSVFNVVVCLIENNKYKKKEWLVEEIKCFQNFLEHIDEGNCIVYYDENIQKDYDEILDILPEPLFGFFSSILANDTHSIKKERGLLKADDLSLIEGSVILRSKKAYLDIASSLHHRIIVSTKEDKENVYLPKHTKGLEFKIICKDVCEGETEIKKLEKINIDSHVK